MSGANSFPQLVGKPGKWANEYLVKLHPGFEILVLPDDSFISKEINNKRIRILIDKKGHVSKAPVIG